MSAVPPPPPPEQLALRVVAEVPPDPYIVRLLHRLMVIAVALILSNAGVALLTLTLATEEDEPAPVSPPASDYTGEPLCQLLAQFMEAQRLQLVGMAEALDSVGAEDMAAILDSTASSLGLDVCPPGEEEPIPPVTPQ